MTYLILMRHGQSVWNRANLFTGWVDVPDGHVLAEVVYDTPKQPACTLMFPLDLAGDITAQVEAQIEEDE